MNKWGEGRQDRGLGTAGQLVDKQRWGGPTGHNLSADAPTGPSPEATPTSSPYLKRQGSSGSPRTWPTTSPGEASYPVPSSSAGGGE